MLLCCTYKLHKIGGAYLVTIKLGSKHCGRGQFDGTVL